MVNIFSGVTPGAELLGAHERLTEQGNLQRQHHELYFFATGAKLPSSYKLPTRSTSKNTGHWRNNTIQ